MFCAFGTRERARKYIVMITAPPICNLKSWELGSWELSGAFRLKKKLIDSLSLTNLFKTESDRRGKIRQYVFRQITQFECEQWVWRKQLCVLRSRDDKSFKFDKKFSIVDISSNYEVWGIWVRRKELWDSRPRDNKSFEIWWEFFYDFFYFFL